MALTNAQELTVSRWPRLSTVIRQIPNQDRPLINDILPGEYFFFGFDERLWWCNPYTLKLEPLTAEGISTGGGGGDCVCKLENLDLSPSAPRALYHCMMKVLDGYDTDQIDLYWDSDVPNPYNARLDNGESVLGYNSDEFEGWTSYIEFNKQLVGTLPHPLS